MKRDGIEHARSVVDTCDSPNGLCEGTWDCRRVRVILDEAAATERVLDEVSDALDELVAGVLHLDESSRESLADSTGKADAAMKSWLRWRNA